MNKVERIQYQLPLLLLVQGKENNNQNFRKSWDGNPYLMVVVIWESPSDLQDKR